jgi:hypothetical protein
VRELLRHRPVEIAGVRTRHHRAVQLDLEREVESPVAATGEMRERRRVLHRSRHSSALQERERRHPRGDRRRERLAEERPERLVLPRLEVSRAPVVHQHDAEDVLGERVDGHGRAEPAGHADHEAELELDVEAPARLEARSRRARRDRLPPRPHHVRPADDDRPGAAVVADRQPPPVGKQRLGAWPEKTAEVRRMLEG